MNFHKALALVHPRAERAMRLKAQGLTWDQVGEQLGITAECAKTRAWRAWALIVHRTAGEPIPHSHLGFVSWERAIAKAKEIEGGPPDWEAIF